MVDLSPDGKKATGCLENEQIDKNGKKKKKKADSTFYGSFYCAELTRHHGEVRRKEEREKD